MYATKAMVTMFNREVEVYQLPDGKYHMSKTQVGQLLQKSHKSLGQFLDGNSPEASPYKNYDHGQVQIEGTQLVIHSVPFEIVVAYISYHARQGNEIAMSIMQNCSVEYMNRCADNGFGVDKPEVVYQQEYVERQASMDQMAQIVNVLAVMQEQIQTMNERLEVANADNREYRQLKSSAKIHPGCMGVLEREIEEVDSWLTARQFLYQKGVPGWTLANTFARRAAQAMRVGKNISKLTMHNGQVVYSPEDIAYLEETFRSMMGM